MALGDRVVVMERGRVRQVGTPAEVYDDPADTFVATFLGSPPMNLVEDGAVTVGFRPEHFRPADGGEREELRAPFTIENVEYLGPTAALRDAGGAIRRRTAFSRLPLVPIRAARRLDDRLRRRGRRLKLSTQGPESAGVSGRVRLAPRRALLLPAVV